jgi:hypothetical protein
VPSENLREGAKSVNKRSALTVRIIVLLSLAFSFLAAKLVGADPGAEHSPANRLTPPDQNQNTFDQEAKLDELRKKIAGREDKPAEEVWQNIQILKGRTAAQVLGVMKVGYSKSLGVTCTHCHVVDQWEKDDKPTKRVARDMALMTRAINNEYLKKIKNLRSESPAVNCTTCHRGQTKPALDLSEGSPK